MIVDLQGRKPGTLTELPAQQKSLKEAASRGLPCTVRGPQGFLVQTEPFDQRIWFGG